MNCPQSFEVWNCVVADFLGSGSMITDGNGAVYQTLIYAAQGEIIANIKNGEYDESYKFTGYERDNESSLSYAHARYYNSELGIFISTDPLWFKYPNWSSYQYSFNNPIRYTDPDGKGPWEEFLFAVRHPIAAKNIGFGVQKGTTTISTVATRFATRGNVLYGSMRGQTDEGSENGAFRHALWQAGITSAYGSQIATEAGNAHEENPNVDLSIRSFDNLAAADQTVDLLNNQIGRGIGEQNAGATMDVLAGAVLDEFAKNGLYTATKGEDGQYTVSKTKLSPEKYGQLKETFKTLDIFGRKPEEVKVPENNPDKPYIGSRQPNL